MKKTGEYGGQIEITALSNLLKKNIKTFIDKDNKYNEIGLGYKLDNSDNYIYLFNNFKKSKSNTCYHFEILIPKKEIEKISHKKFKELFNKRTKSRYLFTRNWKIK